MAYIEKSKSDDWKTPSEIYRHFIEKGYFDPCPYKSDFNGLEIDWKSRNFVNPPYSRLKDWIIKAIDESKKSREVVLLIPSRTDTKGFEMLFDYGCKFIFIIGRLRFNDYSPAPFPSVLVYLKGDGINEIGYIRKEEINGK